MTAPVPSPADLTDAELAEIEARASLTSVGAVPGPWWVGRPLTADAGRTFSLPVHYREADEDGETFDGTVCSITYDPLGFQYPHEDNRELAEFIAAARTDVPRLVASLLSAREELMSARAEREELIAERDQARAELKRVRHALTVIQAARPPLAHSAAIVERLALAVRAREMKPEQIANDEAERGYHNAINGYREVARAILRDIDQALAAEEGTDRG